MYHTNSWKGFFLKQQWAVTCNQCLEGKGHFINLINRCFTTFRPKCILKTALNHIAVTLGNRNHTLSNNIIWLNWIVFYWSPAFVAVFFGWVYNSNLNLLLTFLLSSVCSLWTPYVASLWFCRYNIVILESGFVWSCNCICLSEMQVKGHILHMKLWWCVCTYILCLSPSLSLKPCLAVGDLLTPLCS